MKKVISTILSCAVLLSTVSAVAVAGLENFKSKNEYITGQFSDVAESAWYNESVKSAYELGLVKGNSETTFNPEGEITIAEALVLACRMYDIHCGGDGVFEQGNPWYQVYVDYAVENGLIKDGDFEDYTAKAKRDEFVDIVANALPLNAYEKINDVWLIPDVPKWYSKFEKILMLYNAGILTGSDEVGNFKPSSTIKRSEVATIVTRMVLPELRRELNLPEPTREIMEEQIKTDARAIVNTIKNTIYPYMKEGYEKRDIGYFKAAQGYFDILIEVAKWSQQLAAKCGNHDDVALQATAMIKVLTNLAEFEITTTNAMEFVGMYDQSTDIFNSYIKAVNDMNA